MKLAIGRFEGLGALATFRQAALKHMRDAEKQAKQRAIALAGTTCAITGKTDGTPALLVVEDSNLVRNTVRCIVSRSVKVGRKALGGVIRSIKRSGLRVQGEFKANGTLVISIVEVQD